jgi:hypothetical protein
MKYPSGTKPAVWGAVGGAVAWWVVLAFVFGWSSAGTAEKQAAQQSERAVVSALAPICANRFLAQPDAAVKKAALAKVDSWKRRDEFPKDWVTLPGGYSPDGNLVDACSALVLKSS